jgi:hypothetical protein
MAVKRVKRAYRRKVKDVEPSEPPMVAPMSPVHHTGLLCACGKPVALGQNYVCVEHIR